MDKVCFLMLVVCPLYYCAVTSRSEFTITFKDGAGLPKSEEGQGRSSNPIADLGVLMRNLFTVTNKLHSDIRTSTGFTRHHSAKSGHTHKQDRHDDRHRADKSEPILEVLFDRGTSHKCNKCSKRKNYACGKDRNSLKHVRIKQSLSSDNKLTLTTDKDDKSPVPDFETQKQTPSQGLAHTENSTDTELLRNDITWMVREKGGRIDISVLSDVDKVITLYNAPFLSSTAGGTDEPITEEQLNAALLKDEPSQLSALFFDREVGRIAIPTELVQLKPYSSIGTVQHKDAYCVGTFIGPKHILTAANCIFENKKWLNELDFVLGNRDGNAYEWEKMIVPELWMLTGDHAYNYGMIVVKSGGPQHTSMNFGWHDTSLPLNKLARVFLIGYRLHVKPLDVKNSKVRMWRDFCDMRVDQSSILLEHDCHVSVSEDNGSPIFSPYSSNPVISCINTGLRSPTDKGYCLRISKKIFASLLYWIGQY